MEAKNQTERKALEGLLRELENRVFFSFFTFSHEWGDLAIILLFPSAPVGFISICAVYFFLFFFVHFHHHQNEVRLGTHWFLSPCVFLSFGFLFT